MNLKKTALVLFVISCAIGHLSAQQASGPVPNATLADVLDFALRNKIELKQAAIDKEIGERDIASALAGWYPQVSASGNFVRNMQLAAVGVKNAAGLAFQADQAILSPQLFQASRAAKFIRRQNDLNVENARIQTVVDVSKAYYDILTSEESINIIKENIDRLQRQRAEANARYEVGLVDKTDYKRAQISVNNAQAQLRSATEIRGYKYDFLKMLLGLPTSAELTLSFEDQSLEANIQLDADEVLDIAARVEFRQMQTLRDLQRLNTQYQKWNFLPRIGAFANYGLNYRNDRFGPLFDNNFPNSSVGLSFSLPIFTGTRRLQEIRRSQLQEERLDWDIRNLENRISAEYSAAMASYRASMNEWHNARENMQLSEEVYNTIKLQYDAGVKSYLELMTAETDLKTSQLNYLNALYAVLSGKLDVQRALGTVDTHP